MGRVYVVGGTSSRSRCKLRAVESVDVREGRWRAEPPLLIPRAGLSPFMSPLFFVPRARLP